ncbi:predicted protein [Nematostella vectensis]|uniref:Apoptosis regulatory protein Siva n=1 Tax=Nematostella vectensis TaxID=45351 RepID=A7S4U6_NEMVE|nr:predicted protein [Nematostella vectensis]|eukprot:XP_001633324.1 predicted protein [Nematostella vectensis]
MEPAATPPSSSCEFSSRLLTKRRCPFGESPQQNVKIAATAREENQGPARGLKSFFGNSGFSSGFSAFHIMMNSQKANSSISTASYATNSTSKCWVCQHAKETLPCAFCEHGACEMCVRQCSKCFGVFCSFCSTIIYDHCEDSALCLTCHAEEFRKIKNSDIITQTQWRKTGEQFPQIIT